jgi:acetyl esterase/lipase
MIWLSALMLFSVQPAPPVIHLWPNGAPGSESRKDEAETHPHTWSIANIENPSLTVYVPPTGKANGVAVVIAPGGGHLSLGFDGEGTKPAQFFNSLGITAFVLKYRLFREPNAGLTFEKDTLADTFRAMRLVRHRAAEWGIDPKKIGMMGFSAGGENLNLAAFGPGPGDPTAADPVDREDERPNFGIWIYPGPLGLPDQLPTNSPPAFMLGAQDDGLNSFLLTLAERYRTAHLPYELHVLGSGGHGFNMGTRFKQKVVHSWPNRLADWLFDNGWTTTSLQ